MAEQMQPMPDVPERCPECGAPERRQLLVGNYVASNAIEYDCDTMVIEGGETSESTNCLRRQRDAARAEAERWRKQYEALRAGVERVAHDLHERAHTTARDWQQSGYPYHDGASDAYYEAGLMVRRVLGEAGGGTMARRMTTQAGVSKRTARSVTINVRPEVAAFARAMEHKLAVNDHKEHWREMRVHQLLEMLRDEVDELVRAVADFHGGMGHHRNVLDEAADVANFAMMVADVVALKPCEIGRMEATERE